MLSSREWSDRVELHIYHLDKDPAAGAAYAPIRRATVVIDRRVRLERITTDGLRRALEQAEDARHCNA